MMDLATAVGIELLFLPPNSPKRVGLHFEPNETFPAFQAGDCEHYFGALSANFVQPIDTLLML